MSVRREIDRLRKTLPPVGESGCPGGSPLRIVEVSSPEEEASAQPSPCPLCGKAHGEPGRIDLVIVRASTPAQ